ncbi:unnamed protein product [Mytilus coruscus]|uniref:Uncharacterized protein n=1 Tax=Mytilus coruscus TaxID=42192 RepID=A0A6J8BX64_MYTCO|nr:unnamed protein product [Mytilus coruscus]
MKILRTLVFFCVLAYGFCQEEDQCEAQYNDDIIEGFDFGDEDAYPESEIKGAEKELAEQNARDYEQLKNDKETAQSLISLNPKDPWIAPKPPVGASMCESKFRSLNIGKTFWYYGKKCYVLKPWWNTVFTAITYADCKPQYCKNVPCMSWMFSYRYKCVSSNYKIFNLWLYCPQPFPRIRRLQLKAPQCCECRKFKAPWIAFEDVATKG